MKLIQDGIIDLTWKEALALTPWPERVPRWKRVLAPLQHRFMCIFCGHRSCDLRNEFPSPAIGRTAPPTYDVMEPWL